MKSVGTCVLAFWLGIVSTAAAQTSAEGSIRGSAVDPQGALLPGVTITATSDAAPGSHTAVTDAGGEYRLLGLPPGRFTLVAELSGFAKYMRDNIVVRAGLNLQVPVVMQVGTLSELVEIKAETPMLESRTADRAVNIAGEFQRSLPVSSRRNWADFMELVPGVTTNTQTSEQYNVRGANVDQHVIRVDGISIDSGIQGGIFYIKLSTEALQDIRVKASGGDAAAPLGSGAVMDIATPSGTNALRGAAAFSYQGKSWNDRNAPGTVSVNQQVQTDLSAGGPIRRDLAWFFGAYRYHDRQSGISRTPTELNLLSALVPGYQPFDAENRAHFWFAKATLRLGSGHQAHAWYQYDRNPDRPAGANESALFSEASSGGGAAAGRLTSVWGSALTSQLLYSFTDKSRDSRMLNQTRPVRRVHASTFLSSGRRTGSGQLALLDNSGQPNSRDSYPKTSIAADITYHRRGLLGSHELNTGLYFQHIDGLSEQTYYNNGFIDEHVVLNNPANPSAGTQPFYRRIYDANSVESFRGESANVAWYVQDVWRPLSRVTLNLGIRIEAIRQRDDIFGLQTVSSREIGPRLGVNYLLTSDARNTVQASWSRISSALRDTRLSVGTTAAGFRDLYDNDLDGSFDTVFTNPASTAQNRNQRLDPDYHQPFVDEWTTGYRRQFRGHVAAGVTFVRRTYHDRPTSVEVNGIYDGGVFSGYRDEASRDILFRTNNRWNWPVYSALELEASRQTSRMQLIANYTRQWRHLEGTWQPNDPSSFLQPDAFPNDKGIGSSHTTDTISTPLWRDHVAKVAVAYEAAWGVRLATNYRVQSGHWSGPLVMQLPAPDPRFGPPTVRLSNGSVVSNPLATVLRFAFPTRGEGQFTATTVHVWNIRVGREFVLGGTRLAASVDLFNVTNRADFDRLATTAFQLYSPLYRQPLARQPPRAAQIVLRLAY